MEVEPARVLEISDLPREMQELIMKKLPTEDLLRCRQVSRLWRSMSTTLCRQRRVKLRAKWFEDPNGLDIFKVFDPDDLPWSSYALSDLPKGIESLAKTFLDKFGSHLWHTSILVDFNVSIIIEYLRKSSNLLSLDCSLFFLKEDEDPAELEPVCLPKLKTIKFSQFDGEALTVLESLISAPRLEIIRIWELGLNDMESAERAASLFDKIPVINLSFRTQKPPAVFTGLSTKRLRIRKLICSLERRSLADYERFLAALDLEYLENLSLMIKVVAGGLKTPFKFPKCPSLKTLRIWFNRTGGELPSCRAFIRGIFAQMEPQQFAALRTVKIYTRIDAVAVANFVLLNPSCFETVKELWLSYSDTFLDNWNHIFPNVTTFGFWINSTTQGNKCPCLFSMGKLQQLNIWFDGLDVDDIVTNTMLWLAGIEDPASLNWESDEEFIKYRETHTNPSIFQLTELKEVRFVCDGNFDLTQNQRRDAAACLTFLNMHKLDRLSFDWPISDDCEAQLRAYHRDFFSP